MATTTQARIPNLHDSDLGGSDMQGGVQQIMKAIYKGGVPPATLHLVHLRASQINGCAFCLASAVERAAEVGVTPERMIAASAWRDSPEFDDAERAALALTDAITRLADRPGAVSDELWAEVSAHYDDGAALALVTMAAISNFFNRINTTLRVPPGSWS